jgi:hypothetical protein
MADQKISELTELTSGNIADADEVAVVDTTAGTTKRWTWASIKADILSWLGITAAEAGHLSGVTSAIQTQIDGKAATSHTHTESDITDLDKYTQAQVDSALSGKQDADAQLTSIAGLNPGAEGRMITSDGLGGYQISTPGDVRGYLNVEDGADVTDTANVTSAGALMDSEVADLAGIKSLDTATLQVKPSEGAFVDGDKTKLDGIETGATADQSDAEIEAAYNNQVSTVSQAEAEAGTSTTVRRWTAERVKQAIAALAAGNGDMFAATYDPNTVAGDAFDMDNMVEGATTKIMTAAERTKLSGIETGAEVNVVDSVNSQTGAVVLDADDIDDTSTTHKFATAAELSKLAGIEAGADVTDTANVTAAGALMDSEVTNLNDVKNFDPADYAAASHTHTLSQVTDSGALAALDTVDTAQIDNDAVTYAKMQNISGERLLGRNNGAAGIIEELTYAQVRTALNVEDGAEANPTTQKFALGIACSDETTALTTGGAKATFRMPYAMTLTEVRASVTIAPTGSTLTVDINESGTTILSTKLTIDATEKTSETAATAAVISDSSLADDAEITIDIDQVGSTVAGAGLKVWLVGTISA